MSTNPELDAARRRLADIRRRLANLRTDQANYFRLKKELVEPPIGKTEGSDGEGT